MKMFQAYVEGHEFEVITYHASHGQLAHQNYRVSIFHT